MAQLASNLPIEHGPRLRLLQRPSSRHVAWLLFLALLPVTIVAASSLAYSGNVSTTTYSIQRLQEERDAWRIRNEQLRLELRKSNSLAWVEHEAVGRLQMQKPGDRLYLRVDPPQARASDGRSAR
jgi:hypothetical protein